MMIKYGLLGTVISHIYTKDFSKNSSQNICIYYIYIYSYMKSLQLFKSIII